MNDITSRRPIFPHVVDSSMLSSFRSCPYKCFQQYLRHFKPKAESVHLVAGGAFAKGIEIARRAYFEEERTKEDSELLGLKALIEAYGDFSPPPDSAKSLQRVAGALEFYFASYPFGQDSAIPITRANGRRGIEFSFAEPIDILHPVSGDPILFSGRADMIADFAGGTFVFDEKTTSQLGASWSRQWELRSQFTAYSWACRNNHIPVAGVIVRGVSILKTKYDTQQAITYRGDYEIDRWYAQVLRDIKRMLAMWEDGWWDFNLDHSCAEYGGCPLKDVCKSSNPEGMLQGDFIQSVWDPMNHKPISVEDWENSWEPNRHAQ